MSLPFKRALAVGTTAALALLSLIIVPAHSAPTSSPTTCAGVWVVVQDDQTNPASSIGCATTYATGLDALAGAGFASKTAMTTYGLQLMQIDKLPTDPNYGSNGGFYWSYWSAPVNADGTLGAWTSYSSGPGTSKPAKGVAEGYMLTNDWNLTPGTTRVFTPAASTSPSASPSSSASASSPASSSTSASASSSVAAAVATTSSSPAQSPAVLKAAGYLGANLPTTDDGAGALISAALALSAARTCTSSSALTALVASLKDQAPDYVGTDPGRAANLAIAVVAVGEDPTNFAGLNLLAILAAGTHPDGQVGANVSSYVQSLAVIAYVRAGQPVPSAVLANLVGGQDPTGAFGYSFGGTFYPDYDTTGLAIEALSAAHGDSTVIARAIAWALAQQNPAGYWPNPYSPVDSTGILGSGLEFAGTSAGKAAVWLQGQQLADGGFPASIDGTTSNITATADAMWLLSGSNLVTVSRVTCAAVDPTVTIASGTGASSLADTGGPDEGAVGALAVAMLVAGAGILVLRRSRSRV